MFVYRAILTNAWLDQNLLFTDRLPGLYIIFLECLLMFFKLILK